MGFVSPKSKGRTIRKVMGGGGEGDFQLARFFFFALFLDKYCFVCHLLIKKNYFTKELLYFVGFNNN